ncbi:phosphatidylserine/phosphatidylglycerophosphate/cardiolipin synthase family protein [Rhodococcus sp. B50]|uniref:phosphatidylserine/phosphatidylglycerophosphate/ cardiolipin synthase family protein n=1 Tax=Rhodococcus sp. B50 TaxID=2682847 RepID=UPI0019DC4578|nr:phosphatidylserine/phosphatidylglycerophosphate/cardiolipin synthase family protein [Rhodococcus sp. B50]MBS9376619.1 hypothetical protein [Rhodococcus sp. B50]
MAIAYLDHTAPDLLPLRAGDQLSVNAARAAVRAHATSPTALAHFLDAGVQVLSTPNLHTGLIVTAEKVIVGPASASHASTIADETALITDDPDAIAAAHAFLDSATAIWQIGRVVPLAGIGSRTRTDHDFLPTPVRRMFLRHLANYTPTADKETNWTSPAPGKGAPNPPATRRRHHQRRQHPLHPPVVVDAGPHRIPHTRHAAAYRLRTRTDLDPIAVADAARILTDRGHPNPRLRHDHRVISPTRRRAVLWLWKL